MGEGWGGVGRVPYIAKISLSLSLSLQTQRVCRLDVAELGLVCGTLGAFLFGGGSKTWASLPVLFWQLSLAALSSRELGERLGEQGEPR
jgi:hypothetical protein